MLPVVKLAPRCRWSARLPRDGFAHIDSGDSLNFVPQWRGGIEEQLAMEFTYLVGPDLTLGQTCSAGDRAPCSVMTSVSSPRTTVTDFGAWPVRFCETRALREQWPAPPSTQIH